DPTGITLDASGDIFIADVFNNVIRKITTTGNIYTVAGNGIAGFYGDGGQASLAELYYPTGLAIDDSGNIYIADEDNNRIRKVTTDGVINTIAGNGIGGYSGDGAPATLASLNFPGAVTIDNKMNVYIADSYNNRIRMINSSGIISTIAGNGTKGYSGDDGLATAAQLYNPVGISLDTSGNIYISDSYNFRVRKLTKLTRGFSTANESINIYPNPSHGIFNFKLLNALGNQQLEVFNILGQRVFICNLNPAGLTEINLSQESAGIYLYKITTDTGVNIFRGRIVVL
ncbi:MAG TPA: T9SS type A sorting domain-containing protein, partial [Bacteroidia bacterium]|nr:T9SS type A sorting domain-containing protein [Bacteroidia bacterium]